MNVLKRPLFYLCRKRVRAIILTCVLFFMSTFLLVALSIQKGTISSSAEIQNEANSYFSFSDTSYEPNHITNDMVNEVAAIEGVNTVVPKRILCSEIENVSPVKSETDNRVTNSSISFDYFETYYMNDTRLDSRFTTKTLSIVDGEHISKSHKNSILISEDLATKNGLSVGDTVNIYISPTGPRVEQKAIPESQRTEVTVVGIYEIQDTSSKDQDLFTPAKPENLLFIDIEAAKSIVSPNEITFSDISIYVDASANIDTVMTKAKTIFTSDIFTISTNDSGSQKVEVPLENLYSLVNTILVMIMVTCIVVLLLLLVLWTRSRTKEIGILYAIGKTKFDIVIQLFIECCIVAVLALTLSYFSANAVAQNISDSLVETVNDQQDNDSDIQSAFNDPNRLISGRINEYTVSIDDKDMILVSVTGIGILAIAVMTSSILIFRYKPKDILTKSN